jgi:hypothetical protein
MAVIVQNGTPAFNNSQPAGTLLPTSLPGTATAGNLLVWLFYSSLGFSHLTIPVGWTLAAAHTTGSGPLVAVYYKISDGTETSVSLKTDTACSMGLTIQEFSGVTEPDSANDNGVSGGTSVALSATEVGSGPGLAVLIGGAGGSLSGWNASGWTSNASWGRGANSYLYLSSLTPGSALAVTPSWTAAQTAGAVLAIFRLHQWVVGSVAL